MKIWPEDDIDREVTNADEAGSVKSHKFSKSLGKIAGGEGPEFKS